MKQSSHTLIKDPHVGKIPASAFPAPAHLPIGHQESMRVRSTASDLSFHPFLSLISEGPGVVIAKPIQYRRAVRTNRAIANAKTLYSSYAQSQSVADHYSRQRSMSQDSTLYHGELDQSFSETKPLSRSTPRPPRPRTSSSSSGFLTLKILFRAYHE